jgi:hypothetical protein
MDHAVDRTAATMKIFDAYAVMTAKSRVLTDCQSRNEAID